MAAHCSLCVFNCMVIPAISSSLANHSTLTGLGCKQLSLSRQQGTKEASCSLYPLANAKNMWRVGRSSCQEDKHHGGRKLSLVQVTYVGPLYGKLKMEIPPEPQFRFQ